MSELSFWDFAQKNGDHIAVIDSGGHSISARSLLEQANQVVHGMRSLGLGHGDCVAAILPNGAPMLALFMGAAQAGLYLTPINVHLSASEIAYILKDSQAKALLTTAAYSRRVNEALEESPIRPNARFSVDDCEAPFLNWADFLAGQSTSSPENRIAGGPMTYTSGTTGFPKGVRRPIVKVSPDLVANQQAMFLMLFGIQPSSSGVHLVGAPMYHTAVLNFATNHLHLGDTLLLMEKWDAENMLTLIEQHRVTSSHMVPTQFTRLLKLPVEVRQKYDISSLRHIVHSAAPCPVDIKHEMLNWWGPCIYEYYAASEGGGTIASPQHWLTKPGTVGKPWPISQIRILDDEKQPCASGDVGTVWIRMGEHTFNYHGDQGKTDEAWDQGFFTVGDAGYLDDDGDLFLCDRKSDMIISGGVNIYPAEVEAALIGHPAILDVAVFGIPDEDWGEQVKAVVQLIKPEEASKKLTSQILAFTQERLAKFKCPKTIDYVDSLPRDPNGKLYKRKLRAPYWEKAK
jgi:long-chain acyl-CoA synthetase